MNEKFYLLIFSIILTINTALCQTISKKTKEFAHQYLWESRSFYYKSIFKNFDSTNDLFLIESLGSKKFNDIDIKIYFFGMKTSHSHTHILIEKIHKNNISDYAVFGEHSNLIEVETMCLLFDKYPFPDNVKNRCYEMLIENYAYKSYFNQDELKEDSLFNEHR
jgi:hypothetical protein